MNNIFGGPQFVDNDMDVALVNVIQETGDDAAEHQRDNGWFSHGVLAEAMHLLAPLTKS